MEELMTYKSVYDETILRVFGKYRDRVENLRLNSYYEVNIRQITDLCEVEVIYNLNEYESDCTLQHSSMPKFIGKPVADIKRRRIIISAFDRDTRQRFDIASNLFLILNPNFEAEISKKYKTFNEVEVHHLALLTAHNFAADILMPKKLVINALVKAMQLLNYDAKENFSEVDIDLLANEGAKIMRVPSDSFKYRLNVLDLIR